MDCSRLLSEFRSLAILAFLPLAACTTVTGFPKPAQNDDVEIAANQQYFAADVRDKENAPLDAARGGAYKTSVPR